MDLFSLVVYKYEIWFNIEHVLNLPVNIRRKLTIFFKSVNKKNLISNKKIIFLTDVSTSYFVFFFNFLLEK